MRKFAHLSAPSGVAPVLCHNTVKTDLDHLGLSKNITQMDYPGDTVVIRWDGAGPHTR